MKWIKKSMSTTIDQTPLIPPIVRGQAKSPIISQIVRLHIYKGLNQNSPLTPYYIILEYLVDQIGNPLLSRRVQII
jgi:hypothetical protein